MVVNRSRASVKRLIKFFLSIRETPFTYHQVLSFGDDVTNPKDAKNYLKKILDSLHKRFPMMGSLYVEELQENGRPHYHVRFYFFDSTALPFSRSRMERRLRFEVFGRWRELRHPNVSQPANGLKKSRFDKFESLAYLLKDVRPVRTKERGVNWYGRRNSKIFKENSTKLSCDDVNQYFSENIRSAQKAFVPTRPLRLMTKRDIDYIKAYLETTGAAQDWESIKKQKLKTKRRVSDADYLAYVNSGE